LSSALGNRGIGVSIVTETKLSQIFLDWNDADIIPKDIPAALIFIGTNPDN
jgi:hypothetical protein